jgi:hypothetical protein
MTDYLETVMRRFLSEFDSSQCKDLTGEALTQFVNSNLADALTTLSSGKHMCVLILNQLRQQYAVNLNIYLAA